MLQDRNPEKSARNLILIRRGWRWRRRASKTRVSWNNRILRTLVFSSLLLSVVVFVFEIVLVDFSSDLRRCFVFLIYGSGHSWSLRGLENSVIWQLLILLFLLFFYYFYCFYYVPVVLFHCSYIWGILLCLCEKNTNDLWIISYLLFGIIAGNMLDLCLRKYVRWVWVYREFCCISWVFENILWWFLYDMYLVLCPFEPDII